MSGKYALIIGNTEYTDPGLAQLSAPGKDAEDFARVLRDRDIGAFDEVNILLNQPSSSAIEAIDEFFNQKKPDDLLVLYFSGHGVRDELGALYLAVKNTNRSKLRSTAVKSDYIREAMDQSRSRRQVLILDCCNSGAFAQGTKAATGGSFGTASAFEGGYGRIILTATDSTQFAWEGDKVIGETDNSLFTHFLVEGLNGKADLDGDGRITVDELFDYTYEKVVLATPKQTPSKFSSKQQGEIVLRQNIRIDETLATRTAVLRREKGEQALHFKSEHRRLLQEKTELEARLKEERERSERLGREKTNPVVAMPKIKKESKFPIRWIGIGLVSFATICLCLWGVVQLGPRLLAPLSTQTLTVATPPIEKLYTPLFPTEPIAVPETSTPSQNISPPTSNTMLGEDGATLVYVPEGEFIMGSNFGSDEQPTHTVYLDAFWIDQTEVTNAMYAKCMSAGACQPPLGNSSSTRSSYYGNSEFNDYPVIYVDWNQAKTYCAWAGRRLPTEAEWEKAARGTDGNIYPWGNDAPNNNLLNYNSAVGDTTEVGKYPGGKSPYGAYDMAGNVWEWVNDWYRENYYQSSPVSNPLGPESGQYHVVRGSSWYDNYGVRSAFRGQFDSMYGNILGFRCAVSP
jgi:formylglycine-generating enzyme required for sulfatase activity